MVTFDLELPRFILDVVKAAGGLFVNLFKSKRFSSSTASTDSAHQSSSPTVDPPQTYSASKPKDVLTSQHAHANVIIEHIENPVVVVNTSAVPSAPTPTQNVTAPSHSEDNKLLSEALAEDHKKMRLNRPSIIDGYEEEVALKRINGRGYDGFRS